MTIIKVSEIRNHFWKRDSSLTTMLILLCMNDFVIIPLFGELHFIRILVNFSWMFILLTGIFTLTKTWKQTFILSIFPSFYIIARWILLFHQEIHFIFIDFLFGVFTLITIIVMVMIKVFEKGPVTVHRIIGSVVVYMLIGHLFSLFFQFIYTIMPATFNVNIPYYDINEVHTTFLYFSFTTLTTTGFGDIIPSGHFTRGLVVLEQIIGVLYPVVLIGRLVSLGITRE